jgi:hypothetical protein
VGKGRLPSSVFSLCSLPFALCPLLYIYFFPAKTDLGSNENIKFVAPKKEAVIFSGISER